MPSALSEVSFSVSPEVVAKLLRKGFRELYRNPVPIGVLCKGDRPAEIGSCGVQRFSEPLDGRTQVVCELRWEHYGR